MFKNKQIKAIFSIRGGYGSGRLLDKIDYKLIRNNPKILSVQWYQCFTIGLFAKAGLITFAGPMVAVDFMMKLVHLQKKFLENNNLE